MPIKAGEIMAKSNFIVRGGADFSGIKKEIDKTQKQLQNFKNSVNKVMKSIGTILGGLALGKLIKDSTQMAMGVESAINNINFTMGKSAGAFQKWVETQSQALGMARADAYRYGSVFSNLLSSFTSSAQETAEQTQELMKAAAIIASRTGRTYEDVSERIRSGLLGSTEAIEDLGVYVNISMLESTEAFRRFAGDKSWAQLDFQTQQQIRLAAILEQTYKRYGDTLADTTQTRHAQLIASLKNIQLSLGQAFLPIYNAVLPALTAMANAIGRVVNLIAQFTTALFGAPKQAQATATAVSNQAKSMIDLGDATNKTSKAAKKAGKEAKKSLAAFDEINQLSKQTTTEGAGGGEGAGPIGGGAVEVPSLDTGAFASSTVAVSEKIQTMADRIKKAISSVKNFITENKTAIISALAGIGTAIATYLIGTHWSKIVTVVKTAMSAVGGALSSISVPILGVAALIGLVVAAVVDLWQNNEEFRNKVITAWNGIKDTLSNIWETILKPIFEAIKEVLTDVWNNGIKPLWDKWKNFVGSVIMLILDLWNGLKPVVDWIVDVFGPVIVAIFKNVLKDIGNAINGIIYVVSTMLDAFSGIIDGVRRIFNGLVDFIAGIFTGNWRRAFDGIKNILGGLGNVASSVINGIKNLLKPVADWFHNTFSNAWERVKKVFSTGGKIFDGIKEGIANTFKTVVNRIIDGINRIIRIPFNTINNTLNRIRDISILGLKPFAALWSRNPISVPQIPKLAQGGITNGPTLALVGDNPGGREVISPLDDLLGMIQTAVSNNSGDLYLTVQLGNETITDKIIRNINRQNRIAGKTVIQV